MENFMSLGLPEQLINALAHLKFNTPTPIQAKVIPEALNGKDILASAQTGTGKTAAFGIPLVSKLMLTPNGSALVVTPTRELAAQVHAMLKSLLGHKQSGIKTALLIGGDPITKQLQQLRSNPRLIVGTPGRINDHLLRGSVKLHDTHFLVLDETDRMLDMGFAPQIDKILKFLPKQRQTLLLSATLPKNIVSLAEKFLNDPVRITVTPTAQSTANLKQEILFISEQDKHDHLDDQLAKREGSVIIFVKTKMGAERMAKKLRMNDHSADAIHGDLSHNRRERVIREFRDCKYRIMVATDIASRGLDISHVQHVINFDLPQCPEDYIHRIGRTARAGAEGSAICFIAPSDKRKWAAISYLLNPGEKPKFENNGSNKRGTKRNFERSNAGQRRSFGNGPRSNADGERRSFGNGPRSNADGERRSFNGPRSNADGERRSFNAPRSNADGERRSFNGPRSNADGERRSFNGPRSNVNGEKRSFNGPRSNVNGEKRFTPKKSFNGGNGNSNRQFNRIRKAASDF